MVLCSDACRAGRTGLFAFSALAKYPLAGDPAVYGGGVNPIRYHVFIQLPSVSISYGPGILLFTVMTPLYVTLIYDLLRRQRLRWGYALSALLAVLGAAIIRYDQLSEHFWWGLALVQAANICLPLGKSVTNG